MLTMKNKEMRETNGRKKKIYTFVKNLVKHVQLCTKTHILNKKKEVHVLIDLL